MDNVARVVLALEAPDVAEEVMQLLDRSGYARVVATAGDDRQLAEAVRQLEPDAVVAQPSLVEPSSVRGCAFFAVDTRESVASLRAAIRSGARGFFMWPAEREPLIQAVVAATTVSEVPERRASMFAIHGARGGVGATFIASHLAAALARSDLDCILLDLDVLYADVGAATGAPTEGVHTLADLLPLLGELSPNHLDEAMWRHPAGFRTLLAPEPEEAGRVETDDLRTIIDTASASCDAVVLHLSRTLDEVGRAALVSADRILEVLSLDVLSFRAATRALEALQPLRLRAPIGFVVNRSARSEIVAADVARVFGAPPIAVLPFDRAVARAQDHGRLLPQRGRMARAFDRLAAQLTSPEGAGSEGS